MLKPGILVAACLATFPVRAAQIEENEPLVMRIIFEDCLGYIRHGRTPFRGLAARPASREAIDTIPRRAPDREKAVELLSPRYVASWGQDGNGRHCLIHTVWQAEPDARPIHLGVRSEGFLQRVDTRARAEGLTTSGVADAFTPVSVSFWSEGETGHDRGPLRPVSLSLVASAADEARGLADAGVIVMAGPPQGHPETLALRGTRDGVAGAWRLRGPIDSRSSFRRSIDKGIEECDVIQWKGTARRNDIEVGLA